MNLSSLIDLTADKEFLSYIHYKITLATVVQQ